jgi:cytochrome P450
MMLRHPNDDVLKQWLDGEGDQDLDEHVTTCQRCATNLENMEPPSEDAIGEALAELLAPPGDLTERLEQAVAAKLSSQQIVNVIADLFGAGFETSRLLLTGDEDDND